jgi:5-methyltetrahydrofolate--homocysteine methyltransferase
MKKDISNDAKRSYGYEMADPLSYTLLKDFANENRKKPTEAENLLWDCIKGNLLGVHFRRQHIIGQFIADFVCLSHKLIIEVDGKYHQLSNQKISDRERMDWLENKGFKILRFSNEQIISDTDRVLTIIHEYIINERVMQY